MNHKCPKCSSSIIEKTKFCKICGCNLQEEIIEKPTCPKCNSVFSSEIKFCVQDGTKLVHPDKLIPKCVICTKPYTNGAKYCPDDGGQIMLADEIIKMVSTPINPNTEALEKINQNIPMYSSPKEVLSAAIPTYKKADIGKRFLAYLLDGLITLLFFIPSLILITDFFMEYYTYGSISMYGYNTTKIIFGFILLFLPFTYSLIKDGLGNGQSYGKRALNLMVVNVNSNNPCSKSNSVGRNIMFSIISCVPYIGYLVEVIMVFANSEGRKISDLVTSTQVIDANDYKNN
ncbi:MAG: RDD family protein [Flavobacteriaceae bacterium]|nr:RDD family protein [Flavobacteriaceae bacterium]